MFRSLVTTIVAVVVVAAPPTARAAPDLAVEVSTPGLNKLGDELKTLMPSNFSWPSYSDNLFGCPFSSSQAFYALTAGNANVVLDKVQVAAKSGQVVVDLDGRIPSGSIDATFNVCIGGTSTCKVTFSASQVHASASFTPSLSQGAIALQKPSVSLYIPDGNTTINVSGCGISSVANVVVPRIKGWIIKKLEAWLESLAIDQTRPYLEDALRGMTSFQGTLAGFHVDASFSSILSTGTNLRATGQLSVTPSSPATGYCAVPEPPPVPAPTTVANLGTFNEHVGLAVSVRTLTQGLQATWRAGWLCYDESWMQAYGFDKLAGSAGALLGIPSVTRLRARVPSAPTMRAIGGGAGEVVIEAPFEVEITSSSADGGKEATITTLSPVTVRGELVIDPQTRGLRLQVKSMDSELPSISASSQNIKLPAPKAVKAALDSLVLPTAKNALSNLQLLPQVLNYAGGALSRYYVLIKRRQNTTDHFKIYADLFSKPEHDTAPPDTKLITAPRPLSGGKDSLLFVASGVDAGTPRELLRYRWRVDGTSWSEASFATASEQKLGNGRHVVEVMAIDLNGNSDPTPVRYDIEVDAVAPMIDFADKPADTLDTRSATVVASVTDNRSAPQEIAVKLVLERLDGPRPETAQEIDFTPKTRFELSNLADGKYQIKLTARDEAGNLSKIAQTKFTVSAPDVPLAPNGPNASTDDQSSGGCSAAPGAPAPLGGLLLLALFVVLRRRRR